MSFDSPNEMNLEALLRTGIAAAREKRKDAARLIFEQVLAQDRRNERAWLWLAAVEDDSIERQKILQTVLSINPNNANAKRLLEEMDRSVVRSEQQSLRLGWLLVGFIIVVLIVAVVLVILVTRV
ncbi:MAG: hypothetical protein OHK0023_06350 [Anaerolineae bacterium]